MSSLYLPLTASSHAKNKDNVDIRSLDSPLDSPPQPAEGDQWEKEIDLDDPSDDDLEIVEQSELDHFCAILQKAQRLAADAERETTKSRKRPRKYDGKSKRTLKRREKEQERLEKEGQLSVFGFMARMKERADQRAHMEQLVTSTLKSRQEEDVSEESAVEVGTSDTDSELEVVMTKRGMCQVRRSTVAVVAGYRQCKGTDENQSTQPEMKRKRILTRRRLEKQAK